MRTFEKKIRKMAQATMVHLINFFRKDLSKKEAIQQVAEYSNRKLAVAMFGSLAFAGSAVTLCICVVQILVITAESLL